MLKLCRLVKCKPSEFKHDKHTHVFNLGCGSTS